MPEILAHGEYYAEFAVAAPAAALPELKAQVKAVCGGHVRRIDRFIQLALIGSARCTAGQTLPAASGIYLASGLGPVGSTATLQEQIYCQGVLPKPADFINTLSNTAGYYVARNLGLDGQCLFATRGYSSFEAVLELACVDLAAGRVPVALVGAIDECTVPFGQHARRMRRGQAPVLAEGSHWLLLGPGDGGTRLGYPQVVHADRLPQWTTGDERGPTWWWQAPGLAIADAVTMNARTAGWRPWPGRDGEFPLRSAAAALAFLQAGKAGRQLLINADRDQRLLITEFCLD